MDVELKLKCRPTEQLLTLRKHLKQLHESMMTIDETGQFKTESSKKCAIFVCRSIWKKFSSKIPINDFVMNQIVDIEIIHQPLPGFPNMDSCRYLPRISSLLRDQLLHVQSMYELLKIDKTYRESQYPLGEKDRIMKQISHHTQSYCNGENILFDLVGYYIRQHAEAYNVYVELYKSNDRYFQRHLKALRGEQLSPEPRRADFSTSSSPAGSSSRPMTPRTPQLSLYSSNGQQTPSGGSPEQQYSPITSPSPSGPLLTPRTPRTPYLSPIQDTSYITSTDFPLPGTSQSQQ